MLDVALLFLGLSLILSASNQRHTFETRNHTYSNESFRRGNNDLFGSFPNSRDDLADYHQPNIGENNAPPAPDGLDDNHPAPPERRIANHIFVALVLVNARAGEGPNLDFHDEHEENFRQANAENRAQIVNRHPNIAPGPRDHLA